MDRIEELKILKKEYEEIQVPAGGLAQMQAAIDRAKSDRAKSDRAKSDRSSFDGASKAGIAGECKWQRSRSKAKKRMSPWGLGVAAAAAFMILLPNVSPAAAYAMSNVPILGDIIDVVTFREYHEESDDSRYIADVKIPQLTMAEVGSQLPTSQKTLDMINGHIENICQNLIDGFQASMEYAEGYESLVIDYKVFPQSNRLLTVKLITYIGAGSGVEEDYYYSIDLESGELIQFEDLFEADSDYNEKISENIKQQMRQQMDESDSRIYWIDGRGGDPSWEFDEISQDAAFYFNDDECLVISFNEGEVAPMFMGCVEFEIPRSVTDEILKGVYK